MPGALVQYREREWVVLPSDDPDLILLRPVGGSIDTVKGDAYRQAFLYFCPDLVLVDDVHGAAQPTTGRSQGQQQRHALLRAVAAHAERHLVVLSATPHSGIESSFQSLLALLRPEFGAYSLATVTDAQLDQLARHFVQRRRADVQHWMDEETPFPRRDTQDVEQPYRFSPAYRKFYEAVYEFAGEMVRSAETLTGWRQRMRFWSALALLRCVSSSPAAAQAALLKRAGAERTPDAAAAGWEDWESADVDAEFTPLVYDPVEAKNASDAPPSAVFDAQERDPAWGLSERERLRRFAQQAGKLRGADDAKLQKLGAVVHDLLAAG